MTREEALRRAQQAMGCRKVLIAKPRCDLHVQLWPCDQSRAVADLLLAVKREARAAALDEALVEGGALREERCCDAALREFHEFGDTDIVMCDEMGETCKRRLATEWRAE